MHMDPLEFPEVVIAPDARIVREWLSLERSTQPACFRAPPCATGGFAWSATSENRCQLPRRIQNISSGNLLRFAQSSRRTYSWRCVNSIVRIDAKRALLAVCAASIVCIQMPGWLRLSDMDY